MEYQKNDVVADININNNNNQNHRIYSEWNKKYSANHILAQTAQQLTAAAIRTNWRHYE